MNFSRTLCLLLAIYAAYFSINSLMPSYETDLKKGDGAFAVDRALKHVKNLSLEPHGVGFPGHSRAAAYIIGELKSMGLVTSIQEGYTCGDWGNLSKATNIMAKIPGSEPGKALLLMSHYDSSPHSSFGASDAGSGVATVLEGVRAFLAQNQVPKNDIIVLITDAEELGLNGAKLFVNEHPWASQVGLVINFEARGSGGPSYMLMETNRGNANMIAEFSKAHPKFPVANSLAYSIYKMLPNDTDLTVFREDADIEGFNLAFIDDHFDYHTALDTYERLDRESLAHQGSYLMPLLAHFASANLTDLKSLNDKVYFNMPFFHVVSYPFEWIWIIYGVAFLAFLALLIVGFQKKVLQAKAIFKACIPLVITLAINGLFGYFSWSALTWWYPGYEDMLQGFTYNGHSYIFACSFFALGICFFVYNRYKKISTPNLLVAPLAVWLILCGLLSNFLAGASFFVLPVFGLLIALLVYINQKQPNPFLLLFLALPALFMFTPFVKMFPVGLGLKMLVASTLVVTLLYFLLLPLFGLSQHKMRFAVLAMFLFMIFSIGAHINSTFSDERPKPSSLLYVQHADTGNSQWASYDKVPIGWNSQYLAGTNSNENASASEKTLSSKYNTAFTYTAEATNKKLKAPDVTIMQDTIIENTRKLSLCISPNRPVNRLEVFTNEVPLEKASVNGVVLSDYYLKNRQAGKLVTHYISDNDYTEIALVFPKEHSLQLTLYEAANDLLTNPLFTVPKRPKRSIPMPFVLNDATMIIKTIDFE